MQFYKERLYILMEGKPNSPEIPFLKRVIGQLINCQQLPSVEFEVVEVGSSNAFNPMATLIYRESELHKRIPVLAITDRDFRDQQHIRAIKQKKDEKLMLP